jgi:hypothetical protein
MKIEISGTASLMRPTTTGKMGPRSFLTLPLETNTHRAIANSKEDHMKQNRSYALGPWSTNFLW